MRRPENLSLNALRTIAAVLVVVSHVKTLYILDYPAVPHTMFNRLFYDVSALGHAAVIVFFVLSGYWVGGSVLRAQRASRFSWIDYGIARLTRLWLVLIPALLITGVADALLLHSFPTTSLAQGWHGYYSLPLHLRSELTPLVGLGNLIFLQGIHTSMFGNNGPLWSLAYEFWFYLLFPIVVLVLASRRPEHRLGYLILGLGVAAIIGTTVVEYFALWVLGAVIADRQDRIVVIVKARSTLMQAAARVVMLVVVFGAMLVDKKYVAFYTDAVLAVCVSALVCLLVVDPGWGLLTRPIRLLARYAKSSYSLYAIHFPLVVLGAAILVPQHAQRWQPTPEHLVEMLAVVGAVMIIAAGFARLTEHNTDRVRKLVGEWLHRTKADVGIMLRPPERVLQADPAVDDTGVSLLTRAQAAEPR